MFNKSFIMERLSGEELDRVVKNLALLGPDSKAWTWGRSTFRIEAHLSWSEKRGRYHTYSVYIPGWVAKDLRKQITDNDLEITLLSGQHNNEG